MIKTKTYNEFLNESNFQLKDKFLVFCSDDDVIDVYHTLNEYGYKWHNPLDLVSLRSSDSPYHAILVGELSPYTMTYCEYDNEQDANYLHQDFKEFLALKYLTLHQRVEFLQFLRHQDIITPSYEPRKIIRD